MYQSSLSFHQKKTLTVILILRHSLQENKEFDIYHIRRKEEGAGSGNICCTFFVKIRELKNLVMNKVLYLCFYLGRFDGGEFGCWLLQARRLKHVHDVLQEMNPGERQALYDVFREILRLDCNDVSTLTLLASSEDVVRAQMTDGLKNFIIGTLHKQIYKNALDNTCPSLDNFDIPI